MAFAELLRLGARATSAVVARRLRELGASAMAASPDMSAGVAPARLPPGQGKPVSS